ncbi:YkgB family protein [Arachidicoccus terrestris]|uniref:YkgB family protein n=1 Tax=Arachidicoccus terrestris TaxID=2875539 RepID=UPI0021D45561|nr:YkgB family protein [Arachidicoccus terrestris]UAY55995.1 YkgB family protein [Arachidicoccus terrestris]
MQILTEMEKNIHQNPGKPLAIKFAGWVRQRNLPFLIIWIGMVVMLLWAGAYKLTIPGAEGIAPLVNNNPLISWHFKAVRGVSRF